MRSQSCSVVEECVAEEGLSVGTRKVSGQQTAWVVVGSTSGIGGVGGDIGAHKWESSPMDVPLALSRSSSVAGRDDRLRENPSRQCGTWCHGLDHLCQRQQCPRERKRLGDDVQWIDECRHCCEQARHRQHGRPWQGTCQCSVDGDGDGPDRCSWNPDDQRCRRLGIDCRHVGGMGVCHPHPTVGER